MSTANLTNLLPAERKKAIRRIYTLRLLTVFILMVAFIVICNGVLLLPSLIFQHQQNALQAVELERLSAVLAASGGSGASSRATVLAQDTAYLSRLATTTSATHVITALTTLPHQGISLTGISYTAPIKGSEGKVLLSGIATTRTALHSYIESLSAQSFIKNAELPISSYAKEKDIQFTVTVTGTFTP